MNCNNSFIERFRNIDNLEDLDIFHKLRFHCISYLEWKRAEGLIIFGQNFEILFKVSHRRAKPSRTKRRELIF